MGIGHKALLLIIITNFICAECVLAKELQTSVKTRVRIVLGGNKISRDQISKALTTILQEVNKVHIGKGSLKKVREYCTDEGFKALEELVEKTGFHSTMAEYRSRLLETPVGQYEVRGLKVRVELGDTKGDPVEELVFVLNYRLYVENVHFSLETHHYEQILSEGRKLDDMICRHQILDFLEEYRTAHNRKDIEFLERTYGDDALIIVGRVLKKQEGEKDYLESSSLGEEKVRLIRFSKSEYLKHLRDVFKLNSFVRVMFEDIEVIRHRKYPGLYGVKIRQRWNSSSYSDEGYLFVMMDFMDTSRPVIHVRAWQPEPFSDGSVVSLGDFKIIN